MLYHINTADGRRGLWHEKGCVKSYRPDRLTGPSSQRAGEQAESPICLTASFGHVGKTSGIYKESCRSAERFTAFTVSTAGFIGSPIVFIFKFACS